MAKQKVREVAGQAVEKSKAVRVPTFEELVRMSDEALIVLGEELSLEQAKAYVDAGAQADALEKKLKAQVDAIKKVMKACAEKLEWKQLETEKGNACKIGRSSSSAIDPVDLVKRLKELKKQELFPVMVSVKVGEAKKYLGTDVLDDITTTKSEEYGTVSFKSQE